MTKGRQVYRKIKEKANIGVFFDEVSQYWLTGFYSTDSLVIVTEENTLLFLDSRYLAAAEKEKSNGGLYGDVVLYPLAGGVFEALNSYAPKGGAALDSALISLSRFEFLKENCKGREFVPMENICGELRSVKTSDEIEKIKKAQAITDKTFSYILNVIKPGVTEKRIAAEIEFFIKTNGGDGVAFDTIAVSGLSSAFPHGTPQDKAIRENSFITLDFGAKYKGYCSDMTRTVVLGRADDEMRHVYSVVLEAQISALSAIKGGMTGREADGIARDVIAKAGYGKYFGHSLGHSLGIEIHERPNFSPKSETVIPPGAVMTVEPGIYIENKFGVRIEDMVVITPGGVENLTKSPKELIEIC
ncbi:MAG: aminopeptidase P family protein [Eubacteriales bacterium]